MVLGVPWVDHGNWGRETRHRSLFVTECGVLRRTFWQESRLIRPSHIQRCRSSSERIGPRITLLESQPGKQSSRSKRSREITINWADCGMSSIYVNTGKQEALSQEEMVFRFRKGIQSLRKAEVLISCAWEVLGWGGYVLIRRFAPHWSAQLSEPGVFRPGEV